MLTLHLFCSVSCQEKILMMALVMKRIDNNMVSIKEILQLVMCSHLLEEIES